MPEPKNPYCGRCKLLTRFCSCDRHDPPPRSYEVFSDMVLGEALGTVEWYRAFNAGGQHVGTPKMQLSAAKNIVRAARNTGILDWFNARRNHST